MYVNSNSWSRLPNAKYIKQLLDSVLLSPCMWMGGTELPTVAWTVAQNAALALTWDPTRNAAWNTAWCTASTAVWNGTGSAASAAARGAILALVVYDNSGYLLDENPEHVKLLASLGVEEAILLFPACEVLAKEEALA